MSIDIDEISKEMICKVKLNKDKYKYKDKYCWELYDCNERYLQVLSDERRFSQLMKRRYLEKKKHKNNDVSTVWILVGISKTCEKNCEQVGRTTDLINTLNEIREDIKDFYRNGKKYGGLKKNYTELVFYEVDIDKYMENDESFKTMYGNVPEDEHLLSAYCLIRAAYVEGKLGFITSANMYRKSPLDGYFYEYIKKKSEEEYTV